MCIYTFIYTHVHTYIHKHVQYIRHIKPKNIYITCIIKLHFIKLEITKIKRGNIQYTCYHKNKGSTSFLFPNMSNKILCFSEVAQSDCELARELPKRIISVILNTEVYKVYKAPSQSFGTLLIKEILLMAGLVHLFFFFHW